MATFDDLVFDHNLGGTMLHGAHIWFPNGYGASVVFGEMINTFSENLFELAVLVKKNDKESSLCYDTPLTDDVIPNLTIEQVNELLLKIEALPCRTGA